MSYLRWDKGSFRKVSLLADEEKDEEKKGKNKERGNEEHPFKILGPRPP